MFRYRCTMQDKQIPKSTRAELVSGLTRITVELFNVAQDDVQVQFRDVPDGAGYRGGELSTTSLVQGVIPPGCEQSVREKLLLEICEMWCRVTGCGEDEVVVSATDSDYVSKVY